MNLLDSLRTDHRHFLHLVERLDRSVTSSSSRAPAKAGGSPAAEAAAILRELIRSFHAHERIEEGLLWPALQAKAPDAEPMLKVMDADHAGLASALEAFQRELDGAADGRTAPWLLLGVSRLTNMVRSHIAREETDLFSIAARRIPAAELERLGAEAHASRSRP